MDQEIATKLVKAYLNSVNRSFSKEIKQHDESFMGNLGAAIVLYDGSNHTLIVWAVITPNGYKYIARPEYLTEIKRIAKKHPEIMFGARIEVKKFPDFIYGARIRVQPWLTLRKEFSVPQLTAKKFIASIDTLTDLSSSKWQEPMREAHRTVNFKFGLPRKDQIIPPNLKE